MWSLIIIFKQSVFCTIQKKPIYFNLVLNLYYHPSPPHHHHHCELKQRGFCTTPEVRPFLFFKIILDATEFVLL